jgi:hypothetical protein
MRVKSCDSVQSLSLENRLCGTLFVILLKNLNQIAQRQLFDAEE